MKLNFPRIVDVRYIHICIIHTINCVTVSKCGLISKKKEIMRRKKKYNSMTCSVVARIYECADPNLVGAYNLKLDSRNESVLFNQQ